MVSAGAASLSRIVASPLPSAIVAATGLESCTWSVSLASSSASSTELTNTALVVWPGAKTSVPLFAV